MAKHQAMHSWRVEDSIELYGIRNWGNGFFDVSEDGCVLICPRGPQGPKIPLPEVIAGLRPECIHDAPMQLEVFKDSCITVDVDVTELMGAEIYLYLNSYDRTPKEGMSTGKEIATDVNRLIARVSSRSTSRAGDTIRVALDISRIHIFDKDTEKCIVH